ncbi:hypothetical protein GIX45_01750 [Erwinia sp. CPCC 100877]|nr:hypothetical protein [Erwinia sp. CPCC 100877]
MYIQKAITLATALIATDAFAAAPPDIKQARVIQQVNNIEDLVQINGDWIIGSSQSAGEKPGGLWLFNVTNGKPRRIVPEHITVKPDTRAFPHCPGAPNLATLSPERMDYYREGRRLYVVNHNARESVEVFSVSADKNGRPALSWQGCVIGPENVHFSSVVGLSDNRMLISSPWNDDDPWRTRKLEAGQPSGALYTWSSQKGLNKMPGSEQLSGPSGITTSPNEKNVWVAAWAGQYIARITNGGSQPQILKIPLDFHPDNLSWSPDGRQLYAGGQSASGNTLMNCVMGRKKSCNDINQEAVRVDPQTLKPTTLIPATHFNGIRASTGIIQTGNHYWLSGFRNNGVAIAPAQARQ